MSAMKIVHVYGSLGATSPRNRTILHYESEVTQLTVTRAAECLKVIPEGRDDDETLIESRQLLIQADAIGFMGFSYDSANLDRIDSKNTCAMYVLRQAGHTIRFISGTCLGMTKAELRKAISMTVSNDEATIRDYMARFYEKNCLQIIKRNANSGSGLTFKAVASGRTK